MSHPVNMNQMSFRAAFLWLVSFAILYAGIMIPSWNLGHLDFGDGNYMYISWRVANGALLYQDILAPQPPIHFLIGCGLIKLGGLFSHPLYAFRLYSLLLHLLSMFLVYSCTVRMATGDDRDCSGQWRAAGVWAALLYLLVPIGYWWTSGYQSEPTEMAFILGAFYLVMYFKGWQAFFAGVLMALAVLTNMTAAPYALFIGFGLLIRKPRLSLSYWAAFVPIVFLTFFAMEQWTGACIENVFQNQVGSYPRPELLPKGVGVTGYFRNKLLTEGLDILHLEGGFILLGLFGMLTYITRGSVSTRIREFVATFTFCAMLSFLYVTKGGTVDYIFSIAEPFVAIIGGWFILWYWRMGAPIMGTLKPSGDNLSMCAWWGSMLLILIVILYPGMSHNYATWAQKSYECPEYETMQIVREITDAAPNENDLVLVPPHYAFIAQRKIALDYSELLLWTLKYLNENLDKVDGRAKQTVRKLANMITKGEIAFIALDLNQTAKIPEIKTAIDTYYKPLREKPVRTLNTSLEFYVPREKSQPTVTAQ